MRGRYSETKRTADVRARLAFDRAQMELMPRFNIAPTQQAPVIVVQDGEAVLKPMPWGLVPFWAKDVSIGNRMINARAETVREKPAFRSSLKRRRCLVVADGFYEWQKQPGSKLKQPMRIVLQDEGVFGFGTGGGGRTVRSWRRSRSSRASPTRWSRRSMTGWR
jgi:putative SOS response-associated peptidase YedK